MANNQFNIVYSPDFYEDLDSIISYIKDKLKNKIVANLLIDRIEKEIIERSKSPLSYERYKTKQDNVYYRIYIKNYIIFYTIADNTMVIRRLLYSRRNLEKLI